MLFSASQSKILHGLLSAQISPQTAGALLTLSLWKVSNHMGNHSMDIGMHKHRLKTKAYSNIFKTLHCPREWNICVRKHVHLQQDQSKVHLTQGETNINCGLEQDLVSIKKIKYQFWKAKTYKCLKCLLIKVLSANQALAQQTRYQYTRGKKSYMNLLPVLIIKFFYSQRSCFKSKQQMSYFKLL